MSSNNICFFKEADENTWLKSENEMLDCGLIGVCEVNRLNMVSYKEVLVYHQQYFNHFTYRCREEKVMKVQCSEIHFVSELIKKSTATVFTFTTVFDLITALTPISAQSNNSFFLYFLSSCL